MRSSDPVAEGFDRLADEVTPAPPAGFLESIRREAPRIADNRRSLIRTRVGIGAALVGVLVAGAFTEPGRAATDWIAELAGIGDPPTLDHPQDEPGAVVIETGQLPDDTPYEVVARVIDYAAAFGSEKAGDAEQSANARLCFGIDLPTVDRPEQDSYCSSGQRGGEAVSVYGTQLTKSDAGLAFGVVEDPAISDVRVVLGGSQESVAPASLLSVPSDLSVGSNAPRFFVAPVDQALVESARSTGLCAAAFDADGVELGQVALIHPKLRPEAGQPGELIPLKESPFNDKC